MTYLTVHSFAAPPDRPLKLKSDLDVKGCFINQR